MSGFTLILCVHHSFWLHFFRHLKKKMNSFTVIRFIKPQFILFHSILIGTYAGRLTFVNNKSFCSSWWICSTKFSFILWDTLPKIRHRNMITYSVCYYEHNMQAFANFIIAKSNHSHWPIHQNRKKKTFSVFCCKIRNLKQQFSTLLDFLKRIQGMYSYNRFNKCFECVPITKLEK